MENELIIECLISIGDDLINLVKGEGANTYYSNSLRKVINIKEVEEIVEEAKQLMKVK